MLLIAGGSGITPILAILTALLDARARTSRATLIYANRRTASTMFKEELEDLKNRFMTRLSLHLIFSREAVDAPLYAGRLDAGKLSAFLAGPVPAASLDEVFICGPFEMNDQAEAALLGHWRASRAHPHRALRHARDAEQGGPRRMRSSRAMRPRPA